MDILENLCLPQKGRTYGNNIRLQDDDVCPYMTAAVKEFLEAYGPVLVPWPTCSLDMDLIEHALDDFGRVIINRDNLPLNLHELAQAPTKDSDALDIETIGNLVDSVLWHLDDLVRQGVAILNFGDKVAFETVQLNIRIQ